MSQPTNSVAMSTGLIEGRWPVRFRVTGLFRVLVVSVSLLLLGVLLALVVVEGGSRGLPVVRPRVAVGHGLSSLPLLARGQISDELGAGDRAFRIARSGGGFRAANPVQRLGLGFGRSGLVVGAGGTDLGVGLRAFGYGSDLRAVEPVAPSLSGARVLYRHDGLSEWYGNGPLGLEQGFTVARQPGSGAGGPLALSMVLSGGMRASLSADRQSVLFSRGGRSLLRYGGLVARDARGRRLHSWLELHGAQLLLRVVTRGARYPVRIDPLFQQGPMFVGTGESGAGELGYSVALSADGNTALIGGPGDSEGVGAAWVFTRSGSTWTEQGTKLTGGGESGKARFGSAVALASEGNIALIGGGDDGGKVGAAWVFTRSGSTWTQEGSKLTGSEEIEVSEFGSSVALSSEGNTALIGGPGDHGELGAAWVFTRSGSTWAQQGSKLVGSGAVGREVPKEKRVQIGYSVALSANGNTALIGGDGDNAYAGAAWVFTRSGSTWTQQGSKLTPNNEIGNTLFGTSVALSSNGNTALIGGKGDDEFAGAAWIYTRSGSTWTQGSKLTGTGEGNHEYPKAGYFGWGVALSANGTIALVGGPGQDEIEEPPYVLGGAAWEFVGSGGSWSQVGARIDPFKIGLGSFFGSVALSAAGTTAIIGGYGENEDTREGEEKEQFGGAWAFTSQLNLEELYGLANEAEPDLYRPCAGDPVDCATGNQVATQTDVAVGGRGPGLNLTRTYNSQLAATESKAGPFGFGWTGPYSAHLTSETVCNELTCPETVTVTQNNGSTVQYSVSASGTYVAPAWVQATLTKEGSIYIFTLPDQSKLEFNGSGQLTSETDHNGNAITLSYNSKGELEAATDGAGRKLSFSYNSEGFVESAKDPMGHTVKYSYESGNLASVTQPGETSLRWQFKYNAEHEMTSETDGRGHAVTTEYDTQHRVISQIDAMSRTRKWKYATTVKGSETVITEPNGAVTVEEFNGAMLPTSITHGYETSSAATTTYEYNEYNELISETDPDSHITKFGYDAAGDKTSETDANGDETKWSFNNRHEVETTTTPKGETTTIKREAHGNPETIERPAPASKIQKTTYKYDSYGDLTSETDSLSRTHTYEYDTYGDRESETDAAGDKRTWKYNEDSQETATVSPRGNVKGAEPAKYETKTERDAQGRPLKITNPLGHTTQYTYDGNGNLETVTDADGNKTIYTYDADNEQTGIKAPNGAFTETGYDPAGQIISETDANKHTTKYVRNVLEQVTEESDPLGHKTKKEYDAAGNLKTLEDPEKRVTTYKYDPGNRLTEITYSDGKTHSVKYEYDKDSHRVKMIDGTGTSKITYDQLERPTETENGHKEKIKYEYDLDNEQTKITYPNSKAVTHAYDKAGRVETVTDWSSHATKFGYDADSDLTAATFPSETKDEDKYSYNEADEMSEVKIAKGTETLASLVYTRDNDGHLKRTTATGLPGEEATEYGYDEDNRLTKGGSMAYEYDAANNPTKEGSSTNAYNEADELEKGTGVTYAYDELGERTKTTPSGSATTYGYNEAGNLISVERPVEGEHPAITDSYSYDGNGLRASQTISGTTTYLAWDLAESLPMILSDGTNSYIYGPAGLPVEQINNSSGAVLYLHHDQAGSTRMLTGSTGKDEASFTYDAYGNQTAHTGTATTPLGYDGQYTNADTGLIYLRARVYDPKTAQFLTRDPLDALTEEAYGYAHDNPVTGADPTGLRAIGSTAGSCETFQEWWETQLRLLKERIAQIEAEVRHELKEEESLQGLIETTIKAFGGCAAGGAAGTVTGFEVGGVVGDVPGAVAGAGVGRVGGCIAGAAGTVFAPVNPLQPSEGGP